VTNAVPPRSLSSNTSQRHHRVGELLLFKDPSRAVLEDALKEEEKAEEENSPQQRGTLAVREKGDLREHSRERKGEEGCQGAGRM